MQTEHVATGVWSTSRSIPGRPVHASLKVLGKEMSEAKAMSDDLHTCGHDLKESEHNVNTRIATRWVAAAQAAAFLLLKNPNQVFSPASGRSNCPTTASNNGSFLLRPFLLRRDSYLARQCIPLHFELASVFGAPKPTFTDLSWSPDTDTTASTTRSPEGEPTVLGPFCNSPDERHLSGARTVPSSAGGMLSPESCLFASSDKTDEMHMDTKAGSPSAVSLHQSQAGSKQFQQLKLMQPLSAVDSYFSPGSGSNSTAKRSEAEIQQETKSEDLPLHHKVSHRPGLPNELLVQIFHNLPAVDFDSARTASMNFMPASLYRPLLITMLQRGGWSSALVGSPISTLSKTEITEALRSHSDSALSSVIARQSAMTRGGDIQGPSDLEPHMSAPSIAFTIMEVVDFSDLASDVKCAWLVGPSKLLFKASNCGAAMIMATNSTIVVYTLGFDGVRPLSTIICPRRVVALDVCCYCDEIGVAALLEDNLGLACYVKVGKDGTGGLYRAQEQKSQAIRLQDPVVPTPAEVFNTVYLRTETNHGSTIVNQPDRYVEFEVGTAKNLRMQVLGNTLLGKSHDGDTIPTESNCVLYNDIGSVDNPPSTVAICPHRRCVAFGGSDGVTLFWVDARTGEDLRKWFAVNTSAETLYFLSPLLSDDSGTHLRMLSSATHPSERRYLFQTSKPTGWGQVPVSNADIVIEPTASPAFGHYQAVPLSDGVHTLFTDPASGLLCLGTQKTHGSGQLSRKLAFIPPIDLQAATPYVSSNPARGLECGTAPGHDPGIPRLYTATQYLGQGARVICAYGNAIVLYSVPPDVLAFSLQEHVNDEDTAVEKPQWSKWWPARPEDEDAMAALQVSTKSRRGPIWPLAVHGHFIGSINDLVETSVTELPTGDVHIWAFSSEGTALRWQSNFGSRQPSTTGSTTFGQDGREHRVANDTVPTEPLTTAPPTDDTTSSSADTGVTPTNKPTWAWPASEDKQDENLRLLEGALKAGSWLPDDALKAYQGYGAYDAEGNLFIADVPFDELGMTQGKIGLQNVTISDLDALGMLKVDWSDESKWDNGW